jgi:hypothetical protein
VRGSAVRSAFCAKSAASCEKPQLLCQGDALDPVAGFAFVEQEKANHHIATLCRVLGVFSSGY